MSNPIRDPYTRVTRPELFEDFINTSLFATFLSGTGVLTTQSGVFSLTSPAGTGAVAHLASNVAGAPGVLQLSTSSALNDSMVLQWETQMAADDIEFVEVRYQIPSTTGSTTMAFQIGLSSSYAPTIPFASASRSILYNTATDGNLHSVSFQGSANDISLGAIQATNVWNTVRIAFPMGNASVSQTQRFGATGNSPTARADHTANLLTAGQSLVVVAFAVKALAASGRAILIDYVRVVPREISRGGYLP